MTSPTSPVASPVRAPSPDSPHAPQQGTALCLSGGGYRAMLFHLGALWRLNELKCLPGLSRISSVSGGSITAGVLGHRWDRLAFTDGIAMQFGAEIVAPLRALAGTTLDVEDALKALFLPGTAADHVAGSYRNLLFGAATLQDLPDVPRFVINATNLQSGVLWRFSKPYIWDWRVGKIEHPSIELAVAVSASSAFPPVLAPAKLHLRDSDFVPGTGADLQKPPFTEEVFLADGGVYDNLGLETAWKEYDTVLVSDGGAATLPDPVPHTDWLRLTQRVFDLIDNQVRALRKRQVIASYESGDRHGTYWGITSDIANYHVDGALPVPPSETAALAGVATRLEAMPAALQERLINWGYAICDAAMRRHVVAGAAPPAFPYPEAAQAAG
jgi:NTE family protein